MSRSQIRILLVDDDPDLRALLSDRLRFMGFEVACAEDGREALAALRAQRFTLTLLDLQMPNLSGMEVLETIGKEGIETTVIVITALGTLERAVEAMRAGAYDFLPKPLRPRHLEIVIEKALERHSLLERNERLQVELSQVDQHGLERPLIGQSP